MKNKLAFKVGNVRFCQIFRLFSLPIALTLILQPPIASANLAPIVTKTTIQKALLFNTTDLSNIQTSKTQESHERTAVTGGGVRKWGQAELDTKSQFRKKQLKRL